jgi:hypothetical protein
MLPCPPLPPCVFGCEQLTDILASQIIDDGFKHSLIVYEDLQSRGLRLHAAVWEGELRQCPVWTAFGKFTPRPEALAGWHSRVIPTGTNDAHQSRISPSPGHGSAAAPDIAFGSRTHSFTYSATHTAKKTCGRTNQAHSRSSLTERKVCSPEAPRIRWVRGWQHAPSEPDPWLALILTRSVVAAKRFKELFSLRSAALETSENGPVTSSSV